MTEGADNDLPKVEMTLFSFSLAMYRFCMLWLKFVAQTQMKPTMSLSRVSELAIRAPNVIKKVEMVTDRLGFSP